MSADTNLPTLLRAFFEDYLAAQRDVSTNTIHAYRDSIKLLLSFVARRAGRCPVPLSHPGPDVVHPRIRSLVPVRLTGRSA